MELDVRKNGQSSTLSGRDARALVYKTINTLAQGVLISTPEVTRRVKRRVLERLYAGEAIWDKLDPTSGGPADDATIMVMRQRIAGIINEKGELEVAAGATKEDIKVVEELRKRLAKKDDKDVQDRSPT